MTGPTDRPPPEGTGSDKPEPRPSAAGTPPDSGIRDYRHVWDKATATPRTTKAMARGTEAWWRKTIRALGFVTTLAVVLVFLLRPTEVSTLPASVHGVWRTDAPKYATRRFEIQAQSLVFQIGDAAIAVTRHQIIRVRQSETPDGTFFRIEYLESGETTTPLMFEFIFQGGDRPEIRFASQKEIVWTRVGDAARAMR